jgi:hypothetical protein
MALTYFSEFCAAASLSGYVTKWEHPYVALGSRSRFWGLAANTFNFLAIAAGLASLALFIFGMFDVRDSIIRLGR